MFGKRPIIHAVTSALVALCYLLLAGTSAVHEVAHLGENAGDHSCSSAVEGTGPCITELPADDSGSRASLPCFLCLTGYSYSILPAASFVAYLPTAKAENKPAVVPAVSLSRHALPSLRAPPFFC